MPDWRWYGMNPTTIAQSGKYPKRREVHDKVNMARYVGNLFFLLIYVKTVNLP